MKTAIRRIFIPLDPSDYAKSAAKTACHIAWMHDSEVAGFAVLDSKDTGKDKSRLQNLITSAQRENESGDDLADLSSELNPATVVASRKIPRNVVTMNSRVALIDLETSERLNCTVVFPEDVDPDQNKVSVLDPIGSGMLGYQTGDEFEWDVPAGKRHFKIAKISYQPEAKKRSHL